MSILKIEHKALGAPTTERGDGELSTTQNVSSIASVILSEFVGGNSNASSEFASMLFLLNPDTGLHSVLHYQAAYTSFPEHNRYYDQRIIYELTAAEFSKIGFSYSALLPGLTLMRKFNSREFKVSNEVNIPSSSRKTYSDSSEQFLAKAIVAGLMQQKQVFIRLGKKDEYYGDELRTSVKLKTMLNVLDILPEYLRRYVALAFGVKNNAPGFSRIVPYLFVVAHYDDVSSWNAAQNAIIIDWTSDNPKGDIPKYNEGLFNAVAPLLSDYYGKSVRTYASVSNLIKVFSENIDRILAVKPSDIMSIPKGDRDVLNTVFGKGNGIYQHKEVARRLLWLSVSNGDTAQSEVLSQYPDLKNDNVYIDNIVRQIHSSTSLSQIEHLYLSNKQNPTVVSAVKTVVLGNFELIDACASNSGSQISKDLQDSIKTAAKKWSNADKISRLDNTYFGLSVGSLSIGNWSEFNNVYDTIAQDGKLSKKYLDTIPFSLEWKDDFTEPVYNRIKKRLTKEQKEKIRQKALRLYSDNSLMNYVFKDEPISYDEYIKLLVDRQNDRGGYVSLFEEMIKRFKLNAIEVQYRRHYAKCLLQQEPVSSAADLVQKAGKDAVDIKLLDDLHKSKGFVFSDLFLKSLVNCTDSHDMLARLYLIVKGNSGKLSLERCADIASVYGEKFYKLLEEDISDASMPSNPAQFISALDKLKGKSGTKKIIEALEKQYDSQLSAKRPKDLGSLLNMLQDDKNSEIVNNISDDYMISLVEKSENKRMLEYVRSLNEARQMYKSRKVFLLNELSDNYISSVILNVEHVVDSALWKLLRTPDDITTDWSLIVAKRVGLLKNEHLEKVAGLFEDLLKPKDGNDKIEFSKSQKSFVNESIRSISSALGKEGKNEKAETLLSLLPKSKMAILLGGVGELVVKKLPVVVKSMSKKWKWIALALAAIVVAVVLFVSLRGCGRNTAPDIPRQPISTPVEPAQDSLYFRFHFSDSVPDSVPWLGVPLAMIQPFDLVAEAILDTLFNEKISVAFEMKSSSIDSLLRFSISKDSIIYFSKLRPFIEFYRMAVDLSQNTHLAHYSHTLKCVGQNGGKDTLLIEVNNECTLFDLVTENEHHLTDCIVINIDTNAVNNSEFIKRNGVMRPLGRTEYFLWFALQFNLITDLLNK